MIKREGFMNWELPDFRINFQIKDDPQIELLYGVCGETGMADYLIIGRNRGKLFYAYSPNRFEYMFRQHPCSVEALRKLVDDKIAASVKDPVPYRRSVIYWWRNDIKEFLDELDRGERSSVPDGVSGTVQEA